MAGQGILTGLRVVEASAFVAAPLGGLTLAQMGAEVIRIDPLEGGLDYRRWPIADNSTSLFWNGLNKSKRSVALNLADPEGQEIAIALVTAGGPDAGLLLTNFPPRGWLDYERLRTRRPDLIQITMQGDHKGGSAVDYTVNPRLGIPFITGEGPDDAPVNHVLPAWDIAAGHLVSVALLAAERRRSRTGEGAHVKLALEDVALGVMDDLGFLAEARLGATRARNGNELFGAFGRDFVCLDGRRVIAIALTPKQWRSLVEVTGLSEAISSIERQLRLDFSKEGDRFRARRELAKIIGDWIGKRPLAEVAALFQRANVCWAPYQTLDELVRADPACSDQNPLFATVDQPGVGPMLTARSPLRFESLEPSAPGRAPILGEHTEEVLGQVLGIDSVEYSRLRKRGLVRLETRSGQ